MVKLLANSNLFRNSNFLFKLALPLLHMQIGPIIFKVFSDADFVLSSSKGVIFKTKII